MSAAKSEGTDEGGKKLCKLNIHSEKCKKLWDKVKKSEIDRAVDISIAVITVLASGATLITSGYYNWLEHLMTCWGICAVLHVVYVLIESNQSDRYLLRSLQ